MTQPPYPQQPNPPQPNPPQPNPYAQPPQPPAKPKKAWYKRWWVWGLAAVVIIAIAVNGGNDGSSADTSPDQVLASEPAADEAPASEAAAEAPASEAAADEAPAETTDDKAAADPEPAEETYKVGDKVPVGDVTYVVKETEDGVKQLGDSTFGTKAQGQFVIVTFTMTNNGKDSVSFSNDMVKLIGTDDVEYSVDNESWAYLDSDSLYEQINPGNTATLEVAFDVPKDADLTGVQLAEGIFGLNTAMVSLS